MKTLPLAEVRSGFSQIVDDAQSTHERVIITKNGRPAAVLMGVADYDSVIETLDILSDQAVMAQIRGADEDYARGQWHGADDVRQAMVRAGRLTNE